MNAFVKRPPTWVCRAIHGKARQISQGAPRCCCLTNRSGFARFLIHTLRCVMHRSRPAQLSTRSRKKCANLPYIGEPRGLLQVVFRNWMLRALVLPVNADDPPTSAVVEQLDAVDSTRERFRIV